MFYYLSSISFIVYSILVATLFITSLLSSMRTGHYIMSVFKLIIIAFLLYEIFIEWFIYHKPKKDKLKLRTFKISDAYILLSVFAATLFTYILNHDFSLGAVVASSLIGLIGAILFKKYAVPIYCGSFAGMVSSLLIHDPYLVILVGLFTGTLYVLGSETFKGFGGKLGATAYFGTLLASLVYGTFDQTMTDHFVVIDYEVFIIFIIGALGTYLINDKLKTGAVIASSIIGITGGLILPNVFSSGTALAVALFCGTFIGMSTTTKLTSRVSVIQASVIGTIIYLYTTPYFAGLGGKLGLIAFGSTIATAGFYNLRSNLNNKKISKNK